MNSMLINHLNSYCSMDGTVDNHKVTNDGGSITI